MAIDPNIIFSSLAQVFAKPQVTSVAPQDAHKAAAEVVSAIKAVPDIAIVPVKSAWTSKINWTQIIGAGVAISAFFGLSISAADLNAVLLGVIAVQNVGTVIIKTFFSNSVTAASAGKT